MQRNNINTNQIDRYWGEQERAQQEKVNRILGDDNRLSLYKGVAEYKDLYSEKVERYAENSYAIKTDNEEMAKVDGTYFRKQFVTYLNKHILNDGNEYAGDPSVRIHNPKKAAIQMQDLLGKRGRKLYQLALEEELNSQAYMDAVLTQSTKEYADEQWTTRPFIIVAGPSGCGKSHAAKHVVQHAQDNILEKQEGNLTQNCVITVDGGVAREVSQMRKLAIKLAISKGYTGVRDLHKQSSVLETAKNRIKDYVLQNDCPHGVVMPETFSKFPASGKPMLRKIAALENTTPIFCQVVGKNHRRFKEVVAFMGSRRAWKTDWSDTDIDFDDMNSNKNLPESKAYGASGFVFGQIGSTIAGKFLQRELKNKHKKYTELRVVNDLTIVNDGEKDELVPALVHDEWSENWQVHDLSLADYKKMQGNNLAPDIVAKDRYPLWKANSKLVARMSALRKKTEKSHEDVIELAALKEVSQLIKSTLDHDDIDIKALKNDIGGIIQRKLKSETYSTETRDTFVKAQDKLRSRKPPGFLRKYALHILSCTVAGSLLGLIGGSVGMVIGGVMGFGFGVTTSIIDYKRYAAKQPSAQRETETTEKREPSTYNYLRKNGIKIIPVRNTAAPHLSRSLPIEIAPPYRSQHSQPQVLPSKSSESAGPSRSFS